MKGPNRPRLSWRDSFILGCSALLGVPMCWVLEEDLDDWDAALRRLIEEDRETES